MSFVNVSCHLFPLKYKWPMLSLNAGVDPGFQVRGAHLKKIASSGGRREKFGVFRVKNHNFTQKNHIFSNFRGRGVGAPGAPPLESAPEMIDISIMYYELNLQILPGTSYQIPWGIHYWIFFSILHLWIVYTWVFANSDIFLFIKVFTVNLPMRSPLVSSHMY